MYVCERERVEVKMPLADDMARRAEGRRGGGGGGGGERARAAHKPSRWEDAEDSGG